MKTVLKRWYEPIPCDNVVSEPYVSDTEDLRGFEDWQLREGVPISDWDSSAWIKCTHPECDGDPDDVLQNHLGIPIFSFQLRRSLERMGVRGIQYLTIKVLRRDDSEIPGFMIANIINRVKALNLEKSDLDRYGPDWVVPARCGQISGIRKAVLRRDALVGFDIIRLDEFTQSLFVSERFKAEFEASKLTGYSFATVNLT